MNAIHHHTEPGKVCGKQRALTTSGINEANARLGGYEEDIIHRQNTKLTMTLYKYYESDNDIAQLMCW